MYYGCYFVWYQECYRWIKNEVCCNISVSDKLDRNCDPLYGQVDAILDQLTKSRSLHILMILDQGNKPLRFSEIKDQVGASSTTVSRRLGELIEFNLVARTKANEDSKTFEYQISEYGKQLSPIMHSFYDWVKQGTQD